MNVVVFAIGFLSNLEGGFQKSLAFPCAKAGVHPPIMSAHGCSRWKNQQTGLWKDKHLGSCRIFGYDMVHIGTWYDGVQS